MIYRGMNLEVKDGQWFWANPKDEIHILYGPFGSDEEAFNDIDRHKKLEAAAR